MIENLKKLKILYVEDDDFIREHTTTLLKTIFKDVFTACDGSEAIKTYKNHNNVDAIITDINMPLLSGIDMAKTINKQNHHKTPIIAVSAYDCEDYGMIEIKENFAHYLKKPIKIKDLILSVSSAVKGEGGNYCNK